MKTAESFREISFGAIPQVSNFGFLAEGPKCPGPHRGKNLLYTRKCSRCFEKSPRDRHPICGKMETPKLLNVPLHSSCGHARPDNQNMEPTISLLEVLCNTGRVLREVWISIRAVLLDEKKGSKGCVGLDANKMTWTRKYQFLGRDKIRHLPACNLPLFLSKSVGYLFVISTIPR